MYVTLLLYDISKNGLTNKAKIFYAEIPLPHLIDLNFDRDTNPLLDATATPIRSKPQERAVDARRLEGAPCRPNDSVADPLPPAPRRAADGNQWGGWVEPGW